MRDILDVHTHTIASGHAYNTMMEMIREAQNMELEVYGITEHGPRMPGSCHDFYFHNLRVVERQHKELEVLLGAGGTLPGPDGCDHCQPSFSMHCTGEQAVEYAVSDPGYEKSAY